MSASRRPRISWEEARCDDQEEFREGPQPEGDERAGSCGPAAGAGATIKGYRALYLLEGEINFAGGGGPGHVPDSGGGPAPLQVRAVGPVGVVRLWKLDPSDILKPRRIHLMPMVVAMKSTRAQIHEAAMRIEQHRSLPGGTMRTKRTN
jgi:hypothetical protein